jgi:galactoside O-acetyltransferase
MVGELIASTKKFFYGVLLYLPSERLEILRAFFYRFIGIKVGRNVRISVGSIIDVWNRKTPFSIGDNIFIGRNCYITGGVFVGNGTTINTNVNIVASPPSIINIGENCLLAHNVVIRSDDHIFDDVNSNIRSQGRRGGDIIVGQDCWLGANVVLLKGVCLGAHSVVGAGAVVTKSFPPYSVIVGNPAKLMKSRV